MAAVIIRQKDLNHLAKTLLKEIFEFLHGEYILSEFKEMKEIQKEFLENLASNHIDMLHRQFKITEEKREELVDLMKIDENSSELEKKCKVEYVSKLVENAMKDGGIDTEGIYQTLINLKIDSEINEDLYYETKAFLDIFRVFESGYSYLED